MSRALPVARSAATSTMTTSASSASAILCAVVAPTLPAPTTVTLYCMENPLRLQVLDDGFGELGSLEQRGPIHLALEVVGHPLLLDGAAQSRLDAGRRLVPAEPAQHHAAGEDQRSGVDLVLVGVLGSGAVGGLEHGDAVPLVAAGGHAEPAHLGSERVREIVAVEVRGGQDVVLVRPQQGLLEHGVGDAVLDHDLSLRGFAVVPLIYIVFGDHALAELVARHLVAPVAEGAFGELHDVALVHQGDALAPALQRIAQGL